MIRPSSERKVDDLKVDPLYFSPSTMYNINRKHLHIFTDKYEFIRCPKVYETFK